jgi:hypothetical protein
MAIYNDLFMRDNFGDTGQQPTLDAYVSASPDIIPYAQKTLTQQQLINQYGPPLLNQPLQNNQVNNVYVRAKNNYNGASAGKIYVYYATGNLLVQVSQWRNNLIANNNGELYANVSATTQYQVAPGDQPFNFNPPRELGTHFCLVSRVSTQMNPNPLPAQDFTSWQGWVDWVRNNAWVAWHNVDIVNTLAPNGYVASLAFQNISNSGQFYGFQAAYQGMPAGSVLRLYSLPDANGGYYGFDTGAQTINNGNGYLSAGQNFPANYQTTIFTTCSFPGNPTTPPPGVTIETTSLGYQSSIMAPENWKYHPYTLLPGALGLDLEEFGLESGGGFVQITSFNSLFGPPALAEPAQAGELPHLRGGIRRGAVS